MNKYNSYWEKIAQQKRKEEEARIKALNNKMKATQKRVTEIKTLIDTEILPRIEKYKPLSSNEDIKNQYNSNHMLVIDINNQLEMMQEKQHKTFTDDDIMEMDAKLESFMPQLEKMPKELDETFAYDLKIHSGEAYNNIIDIYDNAQTKAVNYQQTLNAYVMRLLQLNSLIVLDRDPRATDYKAHIEASLRTLEDLHTKANQVRENIEKTEDINELNKQYKMMKDLSDASNQELEKLNSNMENLFAYARKLVRAEESGEPYTEDEVKSEETAQPAEEQVEEIAENVEDINTETPAAENQPQAVKPEPAPEPQKPLLKEIDNVDKIAEPEKPVAEPVATEAQPVEPVAPTKEEPKPIVSYRSKLAPSGTITRGKQVMEVKENKLGSQETTAPLLKPLTDDHPVTGGTVKTKF